MSTSIRSVVPILALLLLLLSAEPSRAQSPAPFFYYYEGRRVSLELDPSQIAVRFANGVGLDARRAATNAGGDLEGLDRGLDTGALGVTFIPVRAGHGPLAAIAQLKTRPEVQAAGPVYRFPDGGRYGETDEFIVQFKSSISAATIDSYNRTNGVQVARAQPYSQNVVILRALPGNTRSALQLANRYVESGLVEFAEPNFVMLQPLPHTTAAPAPRAPAVFPNDPYWFYEWAFYNQQPFGNIMPPGIDIRAPNAWATTQGSAQVTIAIVDVGVDGTHPDLTGRLVSGINVIVNPPTSDARPEPDDFHGTAVAGIAAGSGNNGVGIAGICWNCSIMPVKVAKESPDHMVWITTPAVLAAGIDWAWQNGADVLSNSWTMSGPSDDVKASIRNAYYGGRGGWGSTVVFAVGNQDVNTVSFPAYLGAVIGVGATNWCDERKTESQITCLDSDTYWGSNYGTGLEIVAPGEQLLTACNGSRCSGIGGDPGYTYFSGTSASTPLVAGVVGLLYSLNPNLAVTQIVPLLQKSGKSLPATPPDTGSGYKRLDAAGAISTLYDLAVSISGGPGLVRPGDVISYTLNYTNTGLTDLPASVMTVTIPSIVDYVSSNPAFTFQNESYFLALPALARGVAGSATFIVRVKPGTEGITQITTVQIATSVPEWLTDNNVAFDRIVVAKYNLFLPMLGR